MGYRIQLSPPKVPLEASRGLAAILYNRHKPSALTLMNVHVFRREGSSWSLVTPRHTREKFEKFGCLIVNLLSYSGH